MTRQSQKSRLFDLLLERGQQGVFVYEIMSPASQGLGIAQYNARIFELRRQGWDIRSDRPGHFYLQHQPEQIGLNYV